MSSVITITVLTALAGYGLWALYFDKALKLNNNKNSNIFIILVLLAGAIIRMYSAANYYGHETDMACFLGWSDLAYKDGISQFYVSEGFHDYPPGYVYVMYLLGAVKNTLHLQNGMLWMFIKLPAIICDLITAYLVYHISKKRFSKCISSVFALLLVLNPAVILNSSVWGQVDSVLSMFCVLSIYLASEKKLVPSFFAFGLGILIKPQAMFVAPVLVYAVIEQIFLGGELDRSKFLKTVIGALAAAAMVFVLFMPFGDTPMQGIQVVVKQYFSTIGQYNYMTLNAFNIYGALGLNFSDLTPVASILGYLFIALVIVYSAYVFFKNKGVAKYYLSAFVLVFGIFMLSVKMHERYAFPCMFLLLFAFAAAPDKRKYFMYLLCSLSQFFNTAWVLFVYQTDINVYFKSPVIVVASFINIALMIVFVYLTYRDANEAIEISAVEKATKNKTTGNINTQNMTFRISEKVQKITLFDISAILIISVIYGCFAFYNLGNRFAPETEAIITNNEITVDLGEEKEIAKSAYFLGARNLEEDRNLTFTFMDENKNVVTEKVMDDGSVFTWNIDEDVNLNVRYIKLKTNSVPKEYDPTDLVYVKELCLLDKDGNVIKPKSLEGKDAEKLFDEQDFFVDGKSYMSGAYFDEIYYPRTAYEFIHHMSVYEWTHPPLGKVLMGIGISIFGMVPFGWRFIGTLFGVFMVAAMYFLAKRVLKYRWLTVVTCLLFTFDFMHLSQTRLATIDTYVTFFIILMYYYMYKYCKQTFYDTPLAKTFIPLGLSGIFFGLSVASKWTGLYAGAGLAVIFFITLYERYREYKYACLSPDGESNGISHRYVIESFRKNTVKTLIYCVVMFVIIPFVIYTLSYIPFRKTPGADSFGIVFRNAVDMLRYHGKTVVDATHPYSSHWFEWPIIYKPIWYFSNTLDNGLKQGISSFGNPAVWWVGIGAIAFNFAISLVIPLRNKKYFGKNKYLFSGVFGIILALLCVISYIAGSRNESLERLFPCMLLYSVVILGMNVLVTANDCWFKKVSARTSAFFSIGFLAGFLPWTLVIRTTFIYHYFTCVPFMVMMIGYAIKILYDNADNKKAVIIGSIVYVIIAIVLFIMFYPVLTGQPVSYEYVKNWLKWFETWVLVSSK